MNKEELVKLLKDYKESNTCYIVNPRGASTSTAKIAADNTLANKFSPFRMHKSPRCDLYISYIYTYPY